MAKKIILEMTPIEFDALQFLYQFANHDGDAYNQLIEIDEPEEAKALIRLRKKIDQLKISLV
jgi:hypothetical protein